MILPVLLLLLFGMLETGLLWQARSDVIEATREGVFQASVKAGDPAADITTAEAVIGQLSSNLLEDLDYLLIYDPDTITRQACESVLFSAGTTGCVAYPGSLVRRYCVRGGNRR